MMIKEEETTMTAAKQQSSEVISNDNSNDGSEDDKPGEWLKLGLGGVGGSLLSIGKPSSESGSSSSSSSSKIFSCNFCMRKFFSSHALGGHQNAHKRERGTARRYQCERMMTMIGFSRNTPISVLRSLGVQPHSFVHKPYKPAAATPRFREAYFMPETEEQTDHLVWPGSLRLDAQQSQPPHQSLKLDLNLRL